VVFTGGEPAIFDLTEVTNYIKNCSNIRTHIETSGAFDIKGRFDWITVSPKWNKLPIIKNIEIANEIKIIVEDEFSIEKWLNKISFSSKSLIWLHPEWSQRNNEKVLNIISNFVKKNGGQYRAGYQIHKLYNVDLLDVNSKPIIPLGGI
jgi:organic radical activating enzyme